MKIQPLSKFKRSPQNVTFGYSSPLKTMFLKGDLLPKSKGGKTELSNLVLASKEKNQIRGNQPISRYINLEAMQTYINQFKNVKVKDFNGNKYVKDLLQTITRLLRGGK